MKLLKTLYNIPNATLMASLFIFTSLNANSQTKIAEAHTEWKSLFDGTLDNFRIYFRGQGYIEDVNDQKIFKATKEGIHVIKGTNGLITTKIPYSYYHVKVDYRWGAEGGSKNAGLMTHIDLDSKVKKDNRPRSIEINMKHDCPGGVFLAKNLGPFANSYIKEKTRMYLPESKGGISHLGNPFANRVILANYPESDNKDIKTDKNTPNTHPYGEWNTLEAIVKGGESVEIILNGVVVNRLTNIKEVEQGDKKPGQLLTSGGIGLQSEGQEIFYRNFIIKELKP